ncbi:Nramp family divalent metal transporter [Noviherbaspirillum galbum]|uniref:Divalent metal cation transporter MntH n=1 Tax=Noviherbaspirillum galbum TaxID=2709383 RepID=A0A6B3SVC1_9BURK|nr:Nramp family divalent metal transporter [Noviherbaspirillum galbum]NEX64763.1 divalent metal cation transporter [Noviherbaspirillum galbum]
MPPPAFIDTALARPNLPPGDFPDSVPVREHGSWLRRLLGFMGPGYLVAVGYMDPGNWATDIAGGSRFGYGLLWVIMLSNLMAILLQILASRLGIVTGMDLAQACRAHYSRRSVWMQWLLCEIAICATDLAEVIGTAIALNLLFGLPLAWGVVLTAFDVLVVLWLQQHGFRYFEATIMTLLSVIFVCIGTNLLMSRPDWSGIATGFLPTRESVVNPESLYLAIGIIGATVMPHNLYLHSSTVQTRRFSATDAGRRNALRFTAIDVLIALIFAFIVNAAILATAAAAFHANGHQEIAEIKDAYHLLGPALGTTAASMLFAFALLASGQSSTLTATLAGQVVMEGYLQLRMPPWLRRLSTRLMAIVPALATTLWAGERGTTQLLVLSQVILSLQLPFAVIPLIRFTSDARLMGKFVNPLWLKIAAWLIAVLILALNAAMLASAMT